MTSYFSQNITKILIVISLLSLSSIFMISAPAYGQNQKELCSGANLNFSGEQGCKQKANGDQLDNDQLAESKVNKLVKNIINVFSIVVGIVAVIMILIGGFRFLTSGGDSGKVTSARNTILYAIVGLIVVAFAQLIVKFVLSSLVK